MIITAQNLIEFIFHLCLVGVACYAIYREQDLIKFERKVARIVKNLFKNRKEIFVAIKTELKKVPGVIRSLVPEMVKGVFFTIKERVFLKR